jgi:hypothetical protein
MKGVCYLRLLNYEKALELLSKVVVFGRKGSPQVYIWCALC